MRHRVKKKKLNRPHDQRLALKRSLAREIFEHETIITTTSKAKIVKPFVESLLTKAKKAASYAQQIAEKGDPNSPELADLKAKNVSLRREINRHFNSRKLVKRICDEIGTRYLDRNGGYTRIVKLGKRRGDATELSILQLVKPEESKTAATQET
ncbi:MAG: L17 family ribosomal protein [Thermotogota bacterium]|nr:L17 family ribosomal protein [Thermotogota bacterium]